MYFPTPLMLGFPMRHALADGTLADVDNALAQRGPLLYIPAFHHQPEMPPIAARSGEMREMWPRLGLEHSEDPCPIKASLEKPIPYQAAFIGI